MMRIRLYPSCYQVQQAKKDCYLPVEAIRITDTLVEINLQALLDFLTVHRTLKVYDIQKCYKTDNFILISKWGFDGASGQSIYKQRISNEIENMKSRNQSMNQSSSQA